MKLPAGNGRRRKRGGRRGPEVGKGGPKEEKPRRARAPRAGEIRTRNAPTDRGSKPLQRGLERAKARSSWLAGASVIRNCPGRTARKSQGNLPVKPRPKGCGGSPGPVRRTRSGMSGPREPGSQSQEGMSGREAGRSLFGKALKG